MNKQKRPTASAEAMQVHRAWFRQEPLVIEDWTNRLKQFAKKLAKPLIPEIEDFRQMVYADPVLYANVQGMFAQAHYLKKKTPLNWQPEPINFEEFLVLLNAIMYTAPEAYQTGQPGNQEQAGMIGFPINALLAWPMATDFGYEVFANTLVNQQFKKILQHWSKFLLTPESRYVLVEENLAQDVIAWLSPWAQSEMVNVAIGALGPNPNPLTPSASFPQVFQCQPDAAYFGFQSWDDFFTRQFVAGVRPVSEPDNENVIVNACESTPIALAKNVPLSAQFWLKGMPYSLENMLDFDEWAPKFAGGTVYQAFLSALSYHRWHCPVSGTVVKTRIVNGSYYLQNLGKGFFSPKGPDPEAPKNSQAFLSAVATRALIFIQADNPAIGLMCVMPIGMAEVSSCEITVKVGDKLKKGDQLGMFHFGGSTHCLIFGPQVKLQFEMYGEIPGLSAPYNLRVNAKLAEVVES